MALLASAGVLVFEAVTKRFGRTRALDGVTMSVAAGEILLLLGPNGAGKTTLLRLAATLDRATSGRLLIGGVDVREDGATCRRSIGYAGHEPGLYPDLTAEENVRFSAGFHLGAAEAREAAVAALDAMGVAHLAEARARTLSRGLKQRVALARALAHSPRVILLDEPDNALDEGGRKALTGVLQDARRAGRAVVVSTHSPERLEAFATRRVGLAAGRIVQDASSGGSSP